MHEDRRDALETWFLQACDQFSEKTVVNALRMYQFGDPQALEKIDRVRVELEEELRGITAAWPRDLGFNWNIDEQLMDYDQTESAVTHLSRPSPQSFAALLQIAEESGNLDDLQYGIELQAAWEEETGNEIDIHAATIILNLHYCMLDVHRKLNTGEIWNGIGDSIDE